ncbi:hypothetical protein [Aquimarina sp. MMG016]|uniref:hypothetical protein n=1 Tax=Aquimarina sp. MMG016 TaxID=2822690 RepID=UPI001B3A0035|nr:hypothetical protein [Aquimarina sp. MMG016]MBQ4822583.1 hypothetical protein [Aquimarina sp. MMG016]
MKKIFALLAIVLISQGGFAQDDSGLPRRDIKKNDFGINPFNLVAFGALDVGYERILNDNTSFGVDVFYRLADDEDENDDWIDTDDIFDKEFALTGKFKYYIGDRVARGFYVEAFGMYSSGEHDNERQIIDTDTGFISFVDVEEEYSDFALGFGVGGKFVTRGGFVIDVGFGLGRNLFSNESPEIVARPNLYIGYRF